ncbi:hypothetical protein GWK47_024898 [Chionoecetes opilio]|uniref:Uncharacterized protein n=1 Tax=Chionoecetes opilio TaxID=41210 RepID=A0A8J5CDE7_CHIOP|nr:hypothetical protein GWK47_024898 [Chionoecetes opilio]
MGSFSYIYCYKPAPTAAQLTCLPYWAGLRRVGTDGLSSVMCLIGTRNNESPKAFSTGTPHWHITTTAHTHTGTCGITQSHPFQTIIVLGNTTETASRPPQDTSAPTHRPGHFSAVAAQNGFCYPTRAHLAMLDTLDEYDWLLQPVATWPRSDDYSKALEYVSNCSSPGEGGVKESEVKTSEVEGGRRVEGECSEGCGVALKSILEAIEDLKWCFVSEVNELKSVVRKQEIEIRSLKCGGGGPSGVSGGEHARDVPGGVPEEDVPRATTKGVVPSKSKGIGG